MMISKFFKKIKLPRWAIKFKLEDNGYRHIPSLSGGRSHIMTTIWIAAESESSDFFTSASAIIDTGSPVNILSLEAAKRLGFQPTNSYTSDPILSAYCGKELKSLGTLNVRFTFGPPSSNHKRPYLKRLYHKLRYRKRRFRELFKYIDAKFEVLNEAEHSVEAIIGLSTIGEHDLLILGEQLVLATIEEHDLLIPGKQPVLAFRETRKTYGQLTDAELDKVKAERDENRMRVAEDKETKRKVAALGKNVSTGNRT